MNRTESSRSATARLASFGPWVVASLLVVLHAIRPDLEPSWRFLSEYATGRHGWLMQLAFIVWAASYGALARILGDEVRSSLGRLGVKVLWIVAAALVVAGVFPQDPVTAGPDAISTSGKLHAGASLLGIPGLPLAAILISASLRRNDPRWSRRVVSLMGAAHATWVTLALMIAYLAWAVPRAGGFGPQVFAGWMNRLVVASYLFWQWVVATRVERMEPTTGLGRG